MTRMGHDRLLLSDKASGRCGSEFAVGQVLQLTGCPTLLSPSGDMTDLTTTQMAGGLLDEFVRQYCAELEQLR
jgi:hypothetical protein